MWNLSFLRSLIHFVTSFKSFLFLHMPNPTGLKYFSIFLKGFNTAIDLPLIVITTSSPFHRLLTLSRSADALFLSLFCSCCFHKSPQVYISKCVLLSPDCQQTELRHLKCNQALALHVILACPESFRRLFDEVSGRWYFEQ